MEVYPETAVPRSGRRRVYSSGRASTNSRRSGEHSRHHLRPVNLQLRRQGDRTSRQHECVTIFRQGSIFFVQLIDELIARAAKIAGLGAIETACSCEFRRVVSIAHRTASETCSAKEDGRRGGTIRTAVYWIHKAAVSRAQPLYSDVVVWRSLDDRDVGRSVGRIRFSLQAAARISSEP